MASSYAILRRWISRSGAAGIFRSDAGSTRSLSWRELVANRMMSTSESASLPWMMLPPSDDGSGYRFYSLAKKEIHSRGGWRVGSELQVVGSSHGWVALHNPQSHDLSISDLFSERVIKLPPVPEDTFVNTVVLSSKSQGEEEGGLAFMNFGPRGRLAFCSPGRSKEWSFFGVGKERVYNNMVYSSRDKRLFCITEENSRIEGWDVALADDHHQSSRIEWTMDLNPNIACDYSRKMKTLTYIVYAEHTGDLFFLMRRLNLRVDLGDDWVDRKVFCEYSGPACRAPYKTRRFDVYKIDRQKGKLIKCTPSRSGSYEGLAMFVGINHSFAIPASEGLKPNSIYFSYDNRVKTPPHNSFGGEDNGIFDFSCSVASSYPSHFDYPVFVFV